MLISVGRHEEWWIRGQPEPLLLPLSDEKLLARPSIVYIECRSNGMCQKLCLMRVVVTVVG